MAPTIPTVNAFFKNSKYGHITQTIQTPQTVLTNKFAFYCISETKLRSFQIKLKLLAIIPNSQLFGFDLIENDLCTFCKRAFETVLHLFCFCVHVLKFWDNICSWLSHHFKCNIYLNDLNKLFVFEYFESNAKTNVLNCFLLNARFSVFKHRCSNTKPTIESFLHSLRIIKSSKYVIAKTTGTLNKHHLKWICVQLIESLCYFKFCVVILLCRIKTKNN